MIEAIKAKPSKRDFLSIAIRKARLATGSGGTSEINEPISALQPFLFKKNTALKSSSRGYFPLQGDSYLPTNETKSGTNLFAFWGDLAAKIMSSFPHAGKIHSEAQIKKDEIMKHCLM